MASLYRGEEYEEIFNHSLELFEDMLKKKSAVKKLEEMEVKARQGACICQKLVDELVKAQEEYDAAKKAYQVAHNACANQCAWWFETGVNEPGAEEEKQKYEMKVLQQINEKLLA